MSNNPVNQIVSLRTIANWLTVNSGALPIEGAVPVWDGAQFVWSATQSPYMTPSGGYYYRPDGESRYFSPPQ